LQHQPGPSHRDIIVLGASAGGLSALTDLVRGLPADFPGTLFVVVHTAPDNPGVLAQILTRAGPLPATLARDGERFMPGRIYVAVPDHHLLLKHDYMRVTRGPKENGFRPAVDPLFRTAARSHGPRVVGVVLSGGLNDGTHGLQQIVERGGLAIAQDPQEALIPSMPMSAIQNVEVHRVLRASAIGPALCELVREVVEEVALSSREFVDTAEAGDSLKVHTPPGKPTPYTCPECGGALWELDESGKLLRFRCHTGHAFTAESLLSEQEHTLEAVLWSALRALEENAALCRRMADRTERAGLDELARRYRDDAGQGEQRAGVLRRVLQRDDPALPRPADAHALRATPASSVKLGQG
jgi:two-component system chemotaxis response regulator CheB